MSLNLGQLLTIGGGLVVLLGGIATWLRWLRPVWRRIVRFFDRLDETINGRPVERDAWGREIAPAVPALAEQMTGIKEQVELLAANDARLSALETTVAEHGQRLTAMDGAHQLERIASHIDSAKAWSAVEAIASQPGDTARYDDDGLIEEPDTEL